MQQLVTKDIDATYGTGLYLGHQVLIMKSNGFINMTKLCDQYAKRFRRWKESKAAEELIDFIEGSDRNRSDLFIITALGDNHVRGTYVHPDLAVHCASWISPIVGSIVSDIVNNCLLRQHQLELQAKDDAFAAMLACLHAQQARA